MHFYSTMLSVLLAVFLQVEMFIAMFFLAREHCCHIWWPVITTFWLVRVRCYCHIRWQYTSMQASCYIMLQLVHYSHSSILLLVLRCCLESSDVAIVVGNCAWNCVTVSAGSIRRGRWDYGHSVSLCRALYYYRRYFYSPYSNLV